MGQRPQMRWRETRKPGEPSCLWGASNEAGSPVLGRASAIVSFTASPKAAPLGVKHMEEGDNDCSCRQLGSLWKSGSVWDASREKEKGGREKKGRKGNAPPESVLTPSARNWALKASVVGLGAQRWGCPEGGMTTEGSRKIKSCAEGSGRHFTCSDTSPAWLSLLFSGFYF